MTGAGGFIGRNILPLLRESYSVIAPYRRELNTVDKKSVDEFLGAKRFEILLHLAVPRPGGNSSDKIENHFEDLIRGFLNFEHHSEKFEKIIYVGSGAEYNKARNIENAREEDIGGNIPGDPYGFSRYISNKIARGSSNIYNLRIFGCYGPSEMKTRFIRDAIDSSLRGEPISIRQDCLFDYLYVEDLAGVVRWFIENKPAYHDYNVVTGKPEYLSNIAKMIAEKTGNNKDIIIRQDGLNRAYTASNERLLREIGPFNFTSLSEGIDRQIAWQEANDKGIGLHI